MGNVVCVDLHDTDGERRLDVKIGMKDKESSGTSGTGLSSDHHVASTDNVLTPHGGGC